METIKIKINLPKKVYDILINDMEAFHYLKSDGTVNKNAFINDLIGNYQSFFAQKEDELIETVSKQMQIKNEDFPLISSIFFEDKFKKDGNYAKDLQFIIQKENVSIYEEIIDLHLRNRTISQYFREMFILYTSYQQDNREEILFKDYIHLAKKIIKNNHKAIVTLKNGNKCVMDIYGIVQNKESLFNYLLGVSGGKIVSYHIYDVKSIIEDKHSELAISDSEKEKLDLTIEQGPMFPINEIVDAKVRLSKTGLILFNLWTIDRPKPYKVDGDTYYFKGDTFHLAIYFYKFANEAHIISPEPLKEFIKNRYQIAYESYK